MNVKLLHLLCILLFSISSFKSSETSAETLSVGVRVDAAPFSFRKEFGPLLQPKGRGPLRSSGFDGYVVNLCDAALVQVMERFPDMEIEVIEVNPVTRFEYFGENSDKSIDLLCGATTVTPERTDPGIYSKNGLLASMPIYLSGSSFVQLPTSHWPNDICQPAISLLGIVGETTTEASGVSQIVSSGAFGKHSEIIEEALKTPNEIPLNETCPTLAVYRSLSHMELAKMFCDGNLIYYAGDREIIRVNIETVRRSRELPCPSDLSPETFTDERYIVLSRVPSETGVVSNYIIHFNQVLASRILNHNALQSSFKRSFNTNATVKLKSLFWALTLQVPQ